MNLENVKVPRKINPCPIAEAIVEMRFNSNLPADATIGIVFEKLQTKYPSLEKLPIMELPSVIRDKDPKFEFSPHYKLLNETFVILVGPKCLSVTCANGYKGWSNYFEQIQWVFDEINKANLIKEQIRLGVRYINFFECINIFENIKINFSLADCSLLTKQNAVRSEFDVGKFHCTIQITNIARMNNTKEGSSIDIDVIYNISNEHFANSQTSILEAHEVTKKLFFKLLNDNFLKNFSPEY